jgi:hypothetical protein
MLLAISVPDGLSWRMRTYRVVAAAAALTASLAAASEPALAQSLLQRLFGFGAGRAPEERYDRVERYPFSRPAYGWDDGGWEEDYRTYRTMCVRLCDGFYFPISDNVRRERLYGDNRACLSRCDGEARLYYYPTVGGSVQTMVDLSGRSYQSLPNAFRYRKALVAGCTCKPAPWSPEEAARHEGYAAEAAQSVAEADMGPPRAAEEAEGPSVEEPYYFEPPRPYTRPPAPAPAHSRWWRAPWARYGWRD